MYVEVKIRKCILKSGRPFAQPHLHNRPPHRTLPTRICQIVSKNISTQTLPVTESKSTQSTEEVERDSLNLSSEFITPSLVPKHTNGYYADKECSTPSTVPIGSSGSGSGKGEVAPSLGGRFNVNMLKEKYLANRNKGITNIFIDYSAIVR